MERHKIMIRKHLSACQELAREELATQLADIRRELNAGWQGGWYEKQPQGEKVWLRASTKTMKAISHYRANVKLFDVLERVYINGRSSERISQQDFKKWQEGLQTKYGFEHEGG